MQESERKTRRIKDGQQIAKMTAELKQLELDKFELLQQIRIAEAEGPALNAELLRHKMECDVKKKELERKAQANRPGAIQHRNYGVALSSRDTSIDSFTLMAEKSKIDRDYAQLERESEQKVLMARGKIVDLKRKLSLLERQILEETNKKQVIDREFAEIKKEDESIARKALQDRLSGKARNQQSE